MRADPAGLMKGTNLLYAYANSNPFLFIDAYGLKCTVIDSVTRRVKFFIHEEVIYGDWIFDDWVRFNVKCWCHFYRDSRIEVTRIDTYKNQRALECEKEDECGRKSKYYKFETSFVEYSDEYSKAGGREYDWRGGWMQNQGDIKRGDVCSCKPYFPNPPGIYQN